MALLEQVISYSSPIRYANDHEMTRDLFHDCHREECGTAGRAANLAPLLEAAKDGPLDRAHIGAVAERERLMMCNPQLRNHTWPVTTMYGHVARCTTKGWQMYTSPA